MRVAVNGGPEFASCLRTLFFWTRSNARGGKAKLYLDAHVEANCGYLLLVLPNKLFLGIMWSVIEEKQGVSDPSPHLGRNKNMPDANSRPERRARWELVQPFPVLILASRRSHRHFATEVEEVDGVGVCCDKCS